MTDKTRDEINRYLHERILKKCWHEKGFVPHEEHPHTLATCASGCGFTCGTVQASHREGVTPDYCSDSSSRSLLNEVVAMVTENTPFPYLDALKRTTNAIDRPFNATAEMIARACVEAWEARDGK